MITRTTRDVVTFRREFFLKTVGRPLPPGQYEVVKDEELIEGLSFPAYRRTGTVVFVPSDGRRSLEMQSIDWQELVAALDRDEQFRPTHCIRKFIRVERSSHDCFSARRMMHLRGTAVRNQQSKGRCPLFLGQIRLPRWSSLPAGAAA